VLADHLQDGRALLGFIALLLRLLLPLLQAPERRGVLEPELDEHRQPDEDDARNKRYTPAPGRERLRCLHRRKYEEERVPKNEPDGYSYLGEAPVETSLAGWSVLRRQKHRAAPLPTYGETLADAQYKERYRGPDPYGGVGWQKTHERRRNAH
jgi:hypothetical protein